MGMGVTRLNPAEYTVIPRVAVVDEFDLPILNQQTGETEYFAVDRAFLDRCIANGNRREAETGDLCPIVIGKVSGAHHTVAGLCEAAQPEVVGYARNWSGDLLGNTNRYAAYADFWVKNEDVERVKKYPRRSAEIWRGRAEIDPISLLGATTPERDLGLLPIALSRRPTDQEISATVTRTGALDMPTPTDPTKTGQGDPNATPTNADQNQLLSKLISLVTDLSAKFDAMSGEAGAGDANTAQPGAPGAEGAAGAPGAPGAAGEPGEEMSDEEIEKLLGSLEGQGGAAPGAAGAPPAPGAAGGTGEPPARRQDKPEQAMGYPGGQNTTVPTQLSRDEANELTRLRDEVTQLKLSRDKDEIKGKLIALRTAGVQLTDEDIEQEVRDIVALPPDMRPILLNRIEKNYRRAPVGGGVIPAVADARTATGKPGALTPEQNNEVIQLARTEGLSYEAAHKKLHGRFPWEQPKAAI